MSKNAVLIGYSGHSYVLLDVLYANKYNDISYCEPEEKIYNPFNLHYLGPENDIEIIKLLKKKEVFIGIGDNHWRSKIFHQLKLEDISLPSIFHPSTIISSFATIGKATAVMPGAVINACARVGQGVICNSASVIEHECSIADFVHIAPGAVLAGNVSVGARTFIGANSVVKQGIKIGVDVIIGAGTVLVNDVPDNSIVYGNPAKSRS